MVFRNDLLEQGGLAHPWIAREDNEWRFAEEAVLQETECGMMRRSEVQELVVRQEGEGLSAEAVECFVHQVLAKMNPLLRALRGEKAPHTRRSRSQSPSLVQHGPQYRRRVLNEQERPFHILGFGLPFLHNEKKRIDVW